MSKSLLDKINCALGQIGSAELIEHPDHDTLIINYYKLSVEIDFNTKFEEIHPKAISAILHLLGIPDDKLAECGLPVLEGGDI